jgi:hypothetical protein
MRHLPLKRNRAVATRYAKLVVRYESTVHIAAINEWPLQPLLKHALAEAGRGHAPPGTRSEPGGSLINAGAQKDLVS